MTMTCCCMDFCSLKNIYWICLLWVVKVLWFLNIMSTPLVSVALTVFTILSLKHFSLTHSFQDSELKRTVDESERIKRAYGHYFDLCIINDGLEAAFRSLRLALEKLSTEHQWVPVSWVFWESPRARQQGAKVTGQRLRDDTSLVAPEGGWGGLFPHAAIGGRGVWWRSGYTAEDQPHVEHCFLYKVSVPLLSLRSSCTLFVRTGIKLYWCL